LWKNWGRAKKGQKTDNSSLEQKYSSNSDCFTIPKYVFLQNPTRPALML
jgi:hypothetical protein